jgi:hypothetical protein
MKENGRARIATPPAEAGILYPVSIAYRENTKFRTDPTEGTMSMDHDRASELYANWELLDVDLPSTALGLRELFLFLTQPDFQLTSAQTAKLFSSPQLRKSFQALKQDLHVAELPRLAAASSAEDTQERWFPGGRVWNVTSEGNDTQVIFVAEFEDSDYAPTALKLIGPEGVAASLKLERPENGIVQMPLDLSNENHRLIVQLLRDPGSTGFFI